MSTHYRTFQRHHPRQSLDWCKTHNSRPNAFTDTNKTKQTYDQEHINPNNQTSKLLIDTENEYNETKASFRMYFAPPAHETETTDTGPAP